ncbi:hypothetical protein FB566_2071 [Stackebrandtia endophytica]|uniref:Uncharacterized protein n=1 Tax=Stackebrandtia endophytica TaxID=1496996 RepID=A0A543AVC8_9ACTN|nr:hypothetical protein FB566_2071 [Stackebrandtia endophytica]
MTWAKSRDFIAQGDAGFAIFQHYHTVVSEFPVREG